MKVLRFPRHEELYLTDERWVENLGDFIATFPTPYDLPDDLVEEVSKPTEEQVKAAIEMPALYGWDLDSGDLMSLNGVERVGLRCCYDNYGQLIGGHDAGVGFGFSESFAKAGAQKLLDNIDNVSLYDEEGVIRSLTRVLNGEYDPEWNAYDDYSMWKLFEHVFGNRFDDEPEYDDGEIWIIDAEVDAITYWDGSNFRSLFVGGLGRDHEDYWFKTDIEVASPKVQLWGNLVAQLCSTRVGEISTGIIAYTPDGYEKTYPRKLYSQWQGTGWFSHWLEWEPVIDEDE
ncbi:MAG: hypothetical protein D6740_12870 [Alphaproteobacteria bacterium]|nr:MAG: hypothetical protein D6740_12870 [Alphaproteobacteria bacterium]